MSSFSHGILEKLHGDILGPAHVFLLTYIEVQGSKGVNSLLRVIALPYMTLIRPVDVELCTYDVLTYIVGTCQPSTTLIDIWGLGELL